MAEDSPAEIVFRMPLNEESDIVRARFAVRQLGSEHGCPSNTIEALVTSASEIARNAIVHAGGGEMLIGIVRNGNRVGIRVIARDEGPGISDVEAAMRDGFSTGTGLGLGLPSARRLVHDFELRSVVGEGTTVTLTAW